MKKVIALAALLSCTFIQTAPNGTWIVDGRYPRNAAGVQAAINDAVAAGGGSVDASGVGTFSITSEMEVGSQSHPDAGVALILPKAATWLVSIADTTKCGVRLHNKSSIVGVSGQGNGTLMVIAAYSAATKVEGLFCTESAPANAGTFVKGEGFAVVNSVGATMARGAFVAQHLEDGSVFRDILVRNNSGVGAKIYDTCCGVSFVNLVTDGSSGTGARPLVIGDSSLGGGVVNGGVNATAFYNLSATHPGMGQTAVSYSSQADTEGVDFYNLYMEPNASDNVSPGMQIPPLVHGINVFGYQFVNIPSSSTAYAVDLAQWAGPSYSTFIGGKSQTRNVINDHICNKQIQGSPAYGYAPPYTSSCSTGQ